MGLVGEIDSGWHTPGQRAARTGLAGVRCLQDFSVLRRKPLESPNFQPFALQVSTAQKLAVRRHLYRRLVMALPKHYLTSYSRT